MLLWRALATVLTVLALSGKFSYNADNRIPSGNTLITDTCKSDDEKFQCGTGDFIPATWECDGLADCVDQSDERGCNGVCNLYILFDLFLFINVSFKTNPLQST